MQSACGEDENGDDDPKPDYPETLTDVDGNVYVAVEIGGRCGWRKI